MLCDVLVLWSVPVIVNEKLPVGVVLWVVTVIVEEPDPLTDAGLKAAPAPVGSPLALNLTVSVKPPEPLTVVLYVVEFPGRTVSELGLAEIEKLGAATTRVAVAT